MADDNEDEWFSQYEKDADRLREHLEKKEIAPFPCPVCRVTDWQPLLRMDLDLPDRPNAVFPVMPLACQNCGLLFLFGAVKSGVLGPGGKPVDEDNGTDS